ncbi:MAG: class I SAM-dependent methyltransferase [Thermoguttaceae bacterium]
MRHATAYAGVAPRPFHEVLAQLSIDFEKFTFIDFGSGKGRALMLASEYPFAKIIGVDFSPRLNGIAEANLRAYQNPARQCSAIELKCMDATEYEIPAEPAVLFFFNPFGEDLTRLIAKKLQASLQDYPRAVLVVYFWPTARKAWDELGTLQSVSVRQPAWAWPAHRGREIVAVWRTQAET